MNIHVFEVQTEGPEVSLEVENDGKHDRNMTEIMIRGVSEAATDRPLFDNSTE